MNILYRPFSLWSIGKSKKDELFLGNFCRLWQTAPILPHFGGCVKGFFKFSHIGVKHWSFGVMRHMIGAYFGVISSGIA